MHPYVEEDFFFLFFLGGVLLYILVSRRTIVLLFFFWEGCYSGEEECVFYHFVKNRDHIRVYLGFIS